MATYYALMMHVQNSVNFFRIKSISKICKYLIVTLNESNFMSSIIRIPNNLVPVVYNSVIKEGSQTEWEYLWKRFQTENVAGEKLNILNALGHTQQANLTKVSETFLLNYRKN